MPENPEKPGLENSSSPPENKNEVSKAEVTKSEIMNGHNGHVENDDEKASSEPANSENENNSESESEEAPPLFEQTEVIPEGNKRKRNSTIRLTDQISNIEKEKEVLKRSKPKEENLGQGSHLYNMQKVKQAVLDLEKDKKHDDIKTLYKFCTGTGTVKASEVRIKLLRFKGLPFTVEDQKRNYKHEEILGVYPMASLNWCMKMFGIPKPPGTSKQVEVTDKESGEKKMVNKHISPDKDALIAACMSWLYCPKAQKPVKVVKKKPEKKKEPKKVVKKKPEKPKQSEKRKQNDKNKTASPTKKQKSDKTSQLYDDNESSDDDKPLKPAAKKAPGKKELRRCIQKLLKKADLEVVTMKVICTMVYDAFPEHREHVMNKKSDIKAMVKEYISQQ